jgi:fructose 1,6-bisphosphatase
MKKTIKLNEQHAQLVRENMEDFKNDVLKNLARRMYVGGDDSVSVGITGGVSPTVGTTKPFSEAFIQAGWRRSSE